jgi:hypothetical protein
MLCYILSLLYLLDAMLCYAIRLYFVPPQLSQAKYYPSMKFICICRFDCCRYLFHFVARAEPAEKSKVLVKFPAKKEDTSADNVSVRSLMAPYLSKTGHETSSDFKVCCEF